MCNLQVAMTYVVCGFSHAYNNYGEKLTNDSMCGVFPLLLVGISMCVPVTFLFRIRRCRSST